MTGVYVSLSLKLYTLGRRRVEACLNWTEQEVQCGAIIGLPGLLDDVQGWKRWLAVLDECGPRIGLAIATGVFLLAPSVYFRFKDRRAKKLASEGGGACLILMPTAW